MTVFDAAIHGAAATLRVRQSQGVFMSIVRIVCAAALVAGANASLAQVSVNITVPGFVQVAPPPPRYEPMPRARPGNVWVPGHWVWNERAYAWRGGYWQPARADHVYAPGRWVQADGGWRWAEGDWRRAERRHGRDDERRHGHDRDREHGPDGYHCPPGQAKKGRC